MSHEVFGASTGTLWHVLYGGGSARPKHTRSLCQFLPRNGWDGIRSGPLPKVHEQGRGKVCANCTRIVEAAEKRKGRSPIGTPGYDLSP